MSKENLEQFMKQVADSKELQAKIGEAITEDALVALGAAHGCEFTKEDVQASEALSDAKMEGVAGGLDTKKLMNEYYYGTGKSISTARKNFLLGKEDKVEFDPNDPLGKFAK